MLSGFVDLQPGDWVVQNGANSAVWWYTIDNDNADSTDAGGASCHYAGQATRIKHDQPHPGQVRSTLSILRILSNPSFHRDDFSDVEQYLKNLGANHIITYGDLEDKSISDRVKEWTGGKVCVGIVSWPHPLTAI
jgi:hypothetical protein